MYILNIYPLNGIAFSYTYRNNITLTCSIGGQDLFNPDILLLTSGNQFQLNYTVFDYLYQMPSDPELSLTASRKHLYNLVLSI